jgi:hypothetical protein
MQETDLYRYWEYYSRKQTVLNWKGNTLQILEPGSLNTRFGPDITHSRFCLNGVVYQGSVEFHVRINDWYLHGHDYDPAYQDVIFHVLAIEPEKNQTNVSHKFSGNEIPVFVLKAPRFKEMPYKVCHPQPADNPAQVKNALQNLALQRLAEKVILYKNLLERYSAHFIFYQKFLRALGYPYNKQCFEMLALKVPPLIYENEKGNPDLLLALYLGCSGFLHKGYKDAYPLKLRRIYNESSVILSTSSLNCPRWQLAGVRPLNHPHFRIACWVNLLVNSFSDTPFSCIYSILEQRLDYLKAFQAIKKYLSCMPEGYWEKHYALEKKFSKTLNRNFLSEARIKEIITNLIIPLSIAMAGQVSNTGFVYYLEGMYLWLPGKIYYQAILKKIPWVVEYSSYWNAFNSGQSAIALFDHYCVPGKCKKCPIGRTTFKDTSPALKN